MPQSANKPQKSKKTETENKRQYVRLPRPYRVEAKELKFPIARDSSVQVDCSDISVGGLCIVSPMAFDVGTKMQVRIHIPMLNKFSSAFFKVYENDADQFLLAIAEIAWCKPTGNKYLVGMSFVNIEDDKLKALSALIDKAFAEMAAKA